VNHNQQAPDDATRADPRKADEVRRHAPPPATSGTGASATEIPLAQKQDFLWKVHSYTNEYIRFADTKAAFCVGVASALIAGLFASKSQDLFMNAILRRGGATWSALACLSLAAFVFLGASIAASVVAVVPRLRAGSGEGFIFWESISDFGGAAEFAAAYRIQTEAKLNECLSDHLYILASVCRKKYFWVNAAMGTAVVGGVLAVADLLLKR
jgi:hypothetical protein